MYWDSVLLVADHLVFFRVGVLGWFAFGNFGTCFIFHHPHKPEISRQPRDDTHHHHNSSRFGKLGDNPCDTKIGHEWMLLHNGSVGFGKRPLLHEFCHKGNRRYSLIHTVPLNVSYKRHWIQQATADPCIERSEGGQVEGRIGSEEYWAILSEHFTQRLGTLLGNNSSSLCRHCRPFSQVARPFACSFSQIRGSLSNVARSFFQRLVFILHQRTHQTNLFQRDRRKCLDSTVLHVLLVACYLVPYHIRQCPGRRCEVSSRRTGKFQKFFSTVSG
mmetsp:Transcript_22221/g.51254  ORF Transcript_22221/g.51254 Transcript_22221/m.51254 type:complete len:274 (+) Transcript_22221:53-874(+)